VRELRGNERVQLAVAGEAQSAVVIPDEVRLEMQLESIFMPHARRQRDKLYASDKNHARFVHYTSAEAALSIIKSKRVWMRNTTCMSDYREVHHGFGIFNNFFSEASKRNAFSQALDACVPGAAGEALALFGAWWTAGSSNMSLNTYIASISEHDDKEDSHGRLSMWRAFGGSNVARVAIVLKIPWYTPGGARALNVLFSPVAYLAEAEVHKEICSVIESVHAKRDFLRSLDRSLVVNIVFYMLLAGVACLKHEGFHEEREWRVIYTPKRLPSPLMESSVEIVGGIPQIVYKLPLDESVSDDLRGLDLLRIFDRLIIGPSPYPWVMYEAFVAALLKAGVADAENRVFMSNIPIRA
jgi:hypothetical protein